MGIVPALDISTEQRRILEALFREHLPGTIVWAYGSRANWTSRPGSDLDLVVFSTVEQSLHVGTLREAFDESDLPFRVDLFVWDDVPENFREQIERKHVVLVDADSATDSSPRPSFETRALPDAMRARPNRPENWPLVRLGDHADSCLGKMLDSKKNRGNLLPYLGNRNVRWGNFETNNLGQMRFEDHELDRYGLRSGDLVVCEGGEPGRCAIWKDEVAGVKIQKALHRVRTRDQLDSRFLYYWFLRAGRIGALEPYFTGTTIKHLTGRSLVEIQVPLPPKPEQEAIARILGTLEDKIDLNRRTNDTLEAMVRAIFKDWFVDFGPTHAKVEGREPYFAPDLWEQFPATLDHEDKPVSWQDGVLSDIADSPRRTVKLDEVASYTPYIGLEHMPRRSIALSEWGSATDVKSNKSLFKKSEILFGKLRPYFHKVGFAPVDGICSTDIAVVVPKAQCWATFVLACLSSDEFMEYTDRTSIGTKMPRTSWNVMGRFRIHLPSVRVVSAFQSLAQPMVERIDKNIAETRILLNTRDLLLPKLMSGEIRLRDAEKAVEAVI